MKEWMKYYDVSEDGTVRSLDREYINSRGQKRQVKSRVLKTRQDKYGYEKVTLSYNGRLLCTTVGRLVAEKYIPNPENLPQVNHKDEDKMNNRIENLEWCTGDYNLSYGTRLERMSKTKSIPVTAVDSSGHELRFESAMSAAESLGLRQGNISACVRGGQKITGGYAFKRTDVERG